MDMSIPLCYCLQEIARKFITVGMCEQAVDAFLKVNKIKEAIDCCVTLNHVRFVACSFT